MQNFQSQLNNVTNVLIATRPNPTFDAVASMTSLALSLEKMQKKVTLFCPSPTLVEHANLVGVNRVQNQVGNKNLVVTLKGYAKSGVDKVSYNVEGEDFHLVLQPKPGSPIFDKNNIVYTYSGADAELLILVDVQSLEQMGDYYQKEKEFFTKTPIANVDASNSNGNYGQYNLTNPAASSATEIAGYLLQYLKYQVDSDIATNIFYGLMQTTKNLSDPKVRAETYELVGMMMRMGARRVQVMQFLGAQILGGQMTATQTMGTVQPVQPVQPTQPPQPTQNNSINPPADWTQPKIYKGGSLI